MDQDSLQKKMHALEQMRRVETRITEGSLPLIRHIIHELENEFHSPVADSDQLILHRGELWWQDLDPVFSSEDPRCFPVVRDFLAQRTIQIPQMHFRTRSIHDGRSWEDLIKPIREQVQKRMELRHIAGTP